MVIVKFNKFKMLDDTEKTAVDEVGDGSIITRFQKTPFPINDEDIVCPHFMEFKWGWGCPFDCAWCLDGNTKILMADLTWRKLEKIKIGETLIGFTKNKDKKGYRIVKSKVLAKKSRTAETIQIITKNGNVICSPEHKWLCSSGRWRMAKNLRPNDKIVFISNPVLGTTKPFTEEYKIGYFSGISLGDGTWGVYDKNKVFSYRLALKDWDAVNRVAIFCKKLGLTMNKFKHKSGMGGKLWAIRKTGKINYSEITSWINSTLDTQEFWRGFLAGIFDAEGSFDGCSIRVYNTKKEILEKIKMGMQKLGFKFREENHKGHTPNIRLCGGLKENIRFFSLVKPAIKRKQENLFGLSIRSIIPIDNIKTDEKKELFDIQTETENFVANGLVSHNCYLKGTFRYNPEMRKPHFKDRTKIMQHILSFFGSLSEPEILNTGELADSLCGEHLDPPFSKWIIDLFEKQNKHKILFLTKSDNVKNLLEIEKHNQAVISWSLNADAVAKRWEKGAPLIENRIKAARLVQEKGYDIRIRIDPIVPIDDWKIHYQTLIDQIADNIKPSVITMGTPRGLASTIGHTEDKSWLVYLKDNSNWGRRIDFQQRLDIYSFMIDKLKEKGLANIGVCKDTIAIWRSLGKDFTKIKCNCIW